MRWAFDIRLALVREGIGDGMVFLVCYSCGVGVGLDWAGPVG